MLSFTSSAVLHSPAHETDYLKLSSNMQLLQIIAAFAAVGLTWYIGSLVSTYLQARKMGFPIVITPVNPHSVPWMIFSVPLQPFFKRFLPTSIFVRIELSTIGFEHRVRNMTLERFGPSYVLVGPGAMEFWTTDLEIAKAVANNKDVPLSTISKSEIEWAVWSTGTWLIRNRVHGSVWDECPDCEFSE